MDLAAKRLKRSTGEPHGAQRRGAHKQGEINMAQHVAIVSGWGARHNARLTFRRATMRTIHAVLAAGLLACASPVWADQGKNFIVTIDGTDYAIDMGERLTVKGKGGTDLHLALRQSDTGRFHGDFVSFQYGKDLNVTSTEISKGVKQHLIVTNRGTLVAVQEYADLDPRSLATMMLAQISKDDARDGGTMDKQPAKLSIGQGDSLEGFTGKMAIKTSGSPRTVHYEVLTGGTSDHGIVAVSRIDNDAGADDQKIVDRFWETLSVKF
jgi:hypothetical protein